MCARNRLKDRVRSSYLLALPLAVITFSTMNNDYSRNLNIGAAKKGLLELEDEALIPESAPGYQLIKPTKIIADQNGAIYVMDYGAADIKLFDQAGKHKRTIGRSGVGPGELDHLTDVFISANELGVNCGSRRTMSFFSLEGKFLRSTKLPFLISQVFGDSKGNVYGIIFDGTSDKGPFFQAIRYSPKERTISVFASKRWKEPAPFTATITIAQLSHDSIVVGNPDNGYLIQIFNDEGTLVKELKREHHLKKIREDEIEKMTNMGFSTQVFPMYYEPFYRIFASENGMIFAEVHDKGAEEGFVLVDVFHESGKYYGEVRLPKCVDFFWHNQKFYTIQDDSEGLPVVRVYSVKWNL